jgi:cell division protease FtsH
MVTSYGMSETLGPLAYQQRRNDFLGNGMGMGRNVSPHTAEMIDREIRELVESAHQQARKILEVNRNLLEAIANQLLESEVIEGEILEKSLAQVQNPLVPSS